MTFTVTVYIFLLLNINFYVSSLLQGQNCTLLNGGKGRCTRSQICKLTPLPAHHLQICKDPFSVCCPISEKIVTPPAERHQKCVEYAYKEEKEKSSKNVLNGIFLDFADFIVGGTETTAKEFPHMAALGYGTEDDVQWQCGGSLISEQFVLTAAHCISRTEMEQLIRIRLGTSNLQNAFDDKNIQEFGVAEMVVHPDYNPPIVYHDIGLIQLDRQVQITEYVRPACLKTTFDIPHYNLIAIGWGRKQYTGATSDQLQKVSLEHFTSELCDEAYSSVSPRQLPNGIVDKIHICAGGIDGERDTCQGDSGGPLQIADLHNPKLYYIIGITSFGKGCGTGIVPGVYTRVSYYTEWIEKIIWKN